MRRPLTLIVALVVLLAAAAGLYHWTSKRGSARESLADRFPARTQIFLEVARLGQWMDLPEGSETASGPAPRGSDPLLQVLGQVWAAEPVKPQELPVLLKDQPFALGLWHGKDRWEGAALLVLAPGQRSQVESFLSDKLKGAPAGKAGAMELRKAELPGEKVPALFWGVDEARAVVATSPEAASALVVPSGPSLATSEVFRNAVRPLPAGPGGLLFVDGQFARDLGVPELRRQLLALVGVDEKEKPCEAPAPPTPPPPPKTPAEPGAKTEEGSPMDAVGEWAWSSVRAFASPESLAGMAAWTAPPAPGSDTWEVAASLAYANAPQGVWKLLSGAGSGRPTLDNRVPRDGDGYLWMGGFDLAREYREVMEEASKRLPADQMGNVRAALGLVEGKLDLSLANDLLPTVGDEALVVWGREKDTSRWAVVLSLKDPRRFENLFAEKAAKALALDPVTFPGARGWKSSKTGAMTLLVSGGLAVVTADPTWALATGGEEGKAWKQFAASDNSASGLVSFTHESAGRLPAFATWTFHAGGVSMQAKVPGTLPKLPAPEKKVEPAAKPAI